MRMRLTAERDQLNCGGKRQRCTSFPRVGHAGRRISLTEVVWSSTRCMRMSSPMRSMGHDSETEFEASSPPFVPTDHFLDLSHSRVYSLHRRVLPVEQAEHVEEDLGLMASVDVNNADVCVATSGHSIYNANGSSCWASVFLIVNAALGAGLLNFPRAFHEAGGVLVAIGVQVVLLIFVLGALVILAYCADRNFSNTLQDAMGSCCGRWGRWLTSGCVALYCFGTTITFIIIVGDQFDRILASLYGPDFCLQWYLNRKFTMTVTAFTLILPLSYSQKIDFLKVPSLLGVFAILYVVLLVFSEYYLGHFVPGPIRTGPMAWTDVFLVVPDICFGYQCHVSVIPIYSCMRHRTIKNFTVASISGVLICFFCYTVAASFGYLTFGSLVKQDILMSYSAKRPEVFVAVVAMILKTITTYPILLFCGREAIRTLLREYMGLSYESELVEQLVRYSVVSVWFCLSLVAAILIPNIGEIIRVLGSLAAVFIFILPGLGLFQIAMRSEGVQRRRQTVLLSLVGGSYVAFGVFICGLVLTQTLLHHYSSTEEPRLSTLFMGLPSNNRLCQA